MTGRSHLAIGIATGIAVGRALAETVFWPQVLFGELAVGVGLCAFGSLVPDIDSDKSMLGRKFHLPVPHRTITHSIWPVIAIALATLWCGLHTVWGFWWAMFGFGYLSHLVADACGRAGICWAWPFQQYITYDSGAFVAPGHHIKLYRNGEMSEWTCVAGAVVIVFVASGLFMWLFV